MMDRKKLDNIPDRPGCYVYNDSKGIIIYIGKAKSLKKRVLSYFSGRQLDAKTEQLVARIADVDYIITKNEVEALILENTLIKKHKPKYNIDLKDSKRYAYIHVTDEDYPRLLVARNKGAKGSYYGPFVSGEQRDRIIKLLRMLFKIRTCRRMPKKACLRHHIGLCNAPCEKKISKRDYNDRIDAIRHFLKGDIRSLAKALQAKMKEYSDAQNYEGAMQMRDTISALESLSEKQAAERGKRHDQDVINYMVSDGKAYLVVFNVIKGVLQNKSEFEFDYSPGLLTSFITQYYDDMPVPDEIIVPSPVDSAVCAYLARKRKERSVRRVISVKVKVSVPKRGLKKDLLDLARINLENSAMRADISVRELQSRLRLQSVPNIIECFDISNTQGTDAVGSMVVFRNGKPDKRGYRRFRIRTVDGPDDYSSINEVVGRRYRRLSYEGAEMPDLIVIDGGKGQLNAAMQALGGLGLNIPVISLAKQFEEIYVPGMKNPIRLSRRSYALKLLQNIRDEAHRFAITYHKLLRKKRVLGRKR